MNVQTDLKQRFGNNLKLKPTYWLAIVGLLLIVFFFGSGTEQDKMLAAQSDHDHEKALIIASKLLKQNSNDNKAQAVIKKSGQLFHYLQEAKSTLKDLQINSAKLAESPENLLQELQKTRAFTAKAKAIDPQSERLLAFESKLAEVENQISFLFATNALASGQIIISEASSKFLKTAEIFNAAESSTYFNQFLSFQSSGAAIGKPVTEIKASIEPHLQQLESLNQLFAGSGIKDKTLTDSLTTYITAVKSTVKTMLTPQGTFEDFTAIASKSLIDYKKSLNQLQKKLPQHDSIETGITETFKHLISYKVFHDHSIYIIMSSNKALFE